jgi:RNA polymerase sigma factor (sigma-70 family)
MANNQTSEVLQHLRRAALLRDGAGLTDGQLLEDYLRRRDEAALAALVRRHGPMVWGVCRRVLRNYHDAEDAFQATFLVLARKAASVVPREMVANWLYGVAHHTALKARATTAKRGARERQLTQMPEPAATDPEVWDDLQPLLDQELSGLPDLYRVAIVQCDLEGKTRKEAARQLGVPEGTLAARLARGRVMLAKGLARHGLALSGGTLAAVLAENAALAGVPASLVSSTIRAASLFAAGQAAATGVVSAKVAGLAEGVLKTMLLTKVKIVTAVLLAVATLGMGAGWLTHQALAQKPTSAAVKGADKKDRTEVSGVVKAVDASRNTVTLHPGKESLEPRTFTVAGDAQVLLDDGTGDKLGFQEGRLADLSEGASVTLRLSEGQKVVRIWAEGPTIQGALKAADAGKGTITATVAMTKGEPATDKTFTIARNARLFIDDGQAPDKSQPTKQPALADLPANAVVYLKLSADRKVVGSIRAEGQSVTGLVKAVDGAKSTITITISVKGEPQVDRIDRTFAVAKAAQVFIDDGKPKDKAKPADVRGIADVPVGAQVTLRLSLDGQSVVAVVAEGPSVFYGTVKAVDVGKNTLTLHDKVLGEKTYRVINGAVVFLDGKGEAKKLADVPVGAVVDLKLLADQKGVREIRASGPTVAGSVAGNAGNDSITLRDKEGEKTFAVAKDARILIDEKTAGKLTDLIDGTAAQLRLSADQTTALEVRAEGPSFRGTVKVLDPDRNTITLTIGAKAGVGGEDKEFKLTKETVVLTEINGAALKLTDVRADKEVILRLSIDQKAAARITVLGE